MAFAALDLVPVFEWGYETILRHLLLTLKSLLSYHSRISCHHLIFECVSVQCHVFVLTVFQVHMHNRFRIYFFLISDMSRARSIGRRISRPSIIELRVHLVVSCTEDL